MSATMKIPTTKKCTKCGIAKVFAEFYAHKCGLFGHDASCKQCNAMYKARHYAENKATYKERKGRYRSENKDKIKESAARYNAENKNKATYKERKNYNSARYYAKNKKKVRECQSHYYARQKAMREFFKMHRAMHAIAETLNQLKNDDQHTNEKSDNRPVPFPIQTGIRRVG